MQSTEAALEGLDVAQRERVMAFLADSARYLGLSAAASKGGGSKLHSAYFAPRCEPAGLSTGGLSC